MAKFSDLIEGTLARKTVTIEIDGKPILIDVRPLTPFEHGQVLASARAEAKAAGVESPEDGEPIYDLSVEIHTLVIGLVDSDSSKSDPQPYFDKGASQIRGSKIFTRDAIAYLYTLWEQWNDDCSIQKAFIDEAALTRVIEEASVGNSLPFFALRPGVRWISMRTLAARFIDLQKLKSPISSISSAKLQSK